MAKSPQEMEAAMIANMPEKTGKPLSEWLAVVRTSGLVKHGEIVKHLKTEHGMTHGFANLVAHKARQGDTAPADDDLVGAQYSGAKAALRPIYDALVAEVEAFGADVEVAPKKSYVSLRRSKQFGLVQPSTKTRVDVGIQLKGVEPDGRLEASGSFNSMVSHRVRLTEPADVDEELVAGRAVFREAPLDLVVLLVEGRIEIRRDAAHAVIAGRRDVRRPSQRDRAGRGRRRARRLAAPRLRQGLRCDRG